MIENPVKDRWKMSVQPVTFTHSQLLDNARKKHLFSYFAELSTFLNSSLKTFGVIKG